MKLRLGVALPELAAAFAEWEAARERYETFEEVVARTNDEDVNEGMKRVPGRIKRPRSDSCSGPSTRFPSSLRILALIDGSAKQGYE